MSYCSLERRPSWVMLVYDFLISPSPIFNHQHINIFQDNIRGGVRVTVVGFTITMYRDPYSYLSETA